LSNQVHRAYSVRRKGGGGGRRLVRVQRYKRTGAAPSYRAAAMAPILAVNPLVKVFTFFNLLFVIASSYGHLAWTWRQLVAAEAGVRSSCPASALSSSPVATLWLWPCLLCGGSLFF
jgi:hypothetical protein